MVQYSNAEKFNEIIQSIKGLQETFTSKIDKLENRIVGDYTKFEIKSIDEMNRVRSGLKGEISEI